MSIAAWMQRALARRNPNALLLPGGDLSVGMLEQALLAEFPAEDAEDWDRTGLIAGDPRKAVRKVAVALDPTARTIDRVAASGADVLVTHHPIRLGADPVFMPPECDGANASSAIWKAIDSGVALMNFHTALDVSPAAQKVLPGMLGLTQSGTLQPLSRDPRKGYGQVCLLDSRDAMTLGRFAARCTSVFGRAPRTWGDFTSPVTSVVCCTGSVGDCARTAFEDGYDCVVCGEIKYHEALSLADAGLCIVELGHDVSELPLVAPLAAAVERAGVSRDDIILIDQSDNWRYPEAVRI